MKYTALLFLMGLTGCEFEHYQDSIVCLTNDSKVFYHAENVKVLTAEGHYYVRVKDQPSSNATIVSGNCVVTHQPHQ